jgi:hypothetical protein
LTIRRLIATLSVLFLAADTAAQSTPPLAPDGHWTKLRLTSEFWAEGACVADVNRDGAPDVLCGPFWYEGPDFKRRSEIHPAAARFTIAKADGSESTISGFKGHLSGQNGYSDNFLSFAHDIDGDGWTDYLVVGHPGKETFWYKNPRGAERHWNRHLAVEATDNESPALLDLTGDGSPELIHMSGGRVGYSSPDPKDPRGPWNWRPVTEDLGFKWNTHGLGCGDINGDGRLDLITCEQWWEQPASPSEGTPWRRHPAKFSRGGAQMFAYDVNGDGLADVVTSMEGHGYGVAWHEQTIRDGERHWVEHLIVGSKPGEGETDVVFSQPHALDLADVNGDGLKDIVTGKRFWAHGPEGDVEPNAPAVLYWFELKRDGKAAWFIPHLIDDNSGVGTQVTAADVNGDGKPDVVVGNKKGLFVHKRK